MAGINIALAGDARAFLKASGDVEDALEDVSDALDDLAKEAQQTGDKTGDNLADGIKDGARKAEDGTEKLERKFKDLRDTVKDTSKAAGDDLGDNVKRGTDRAGEGLDEFKDEANSTAREAAASFDGSADSIKDVFQELAANAFVGFGPAGAAAGIAAAVGLGVIWEQFNANQEAAKQRISDMADAMIEANSRVVAEQFITDQLQKIYTEADNAAISMAELEDAVRQTGATETEVARAFAGDQDARVVLLERLRAQYALAEEDTRSMDQAAIDSGTRRMAELETWIGALEDLGTDYDSAARRQEGFSSAVQKSSQEAVNAIGETRKAYEDAHRAADAIPTETTTTVKVDVDTSLADAKLAAWRASARRNQPLVLRADYE